MSKLGLTSHKLNFYLAQRAKQSSSKFHTNKNNIENNSIELSCIYNRNTNSISKQNAKQRLTHSIPIQEIKNKSNNKYPSDILDNLETNRSFVDMMQYSAKNNLQNYHAQQKSNNNKQNIQTSILLQGQPSQNNHHKRKSHRNKKKSYISKNIFPQLHTLDNKMSQISNNLSQITFQLARNTRNLQKLEKLSELSSLRKPSKAEVLRRVNFKYANTQRQGQNINKSRIQYIDKPYFDPKYIIWNPQH